MPEPNYRELAKTLLEMTAAPVTMSPVDILSSLVGKRGDPMSRVNAYRAQNRRAGDYMFDPKSVQSQNYGMAGGKGEIPLQFFTAPQQTNQTMQQPQRSMGDDLVAAQQFLR
jgi:hypothetical protein